MKLSELDFAIMAGAVGGFVLMLASTYFLFEISSAIVSCDPANHHMSAGGFEYEHMLAEGFHQLRYWGIGWFVEIVGGTTFLICLYRRLASSDHSTSEQQS